MGNYITVKCKQCGQEFDRSEFHPYIKKCKKCRKNDNKVHASVDDKPFRTGSGKKRRFQYLTDSANYGLKIHRCCIDRMLRMIAKKINVGECCCGPFRRIDRYVGIGYALYEIKDGHLSLYRNHIEHVKVNK